MKNLFAIAALGAVLTAPAAQNPPLGYTDTPMLPEGKWHVHDPNRPRPPVVTPASSPGAPPSDAIVLFNGTDLSHWRSSNGGPAQWKIESGELTVAARSGNIVTAEEFGDCQLHVEWSAPTPAKGESQDRGNSGVFLMSRYEIQVLDSYRSATYADGQAAAIYGQYPPLVNATRPPGEWQTYDIAWTAPRFTESGSVAAPAFVTVSHNGVVVHNHTALLGGTVNRALAVYTRHPPKAPLMLQDHSHPVRYRNIWIRPLKGYDEQ